MMKNRARIGWIGVAVALLGLGSVRPSPELASAQIRMDQFPYQRKLSKDEEKWIDQQLKRLRLEEKIGQMLIAPVPVDFVNIESADFKQLRYRILENRVGGILVGPGGVYETAMLINRLQELARFPLLVASDAEAGMGMRMQAATRLPWNMAIGATGDPAWATHQGEIMAQEARVIGINVLLAPVADLSGDAVSVMRGVRSYGEDSKEVAQFVAAFTRGAQTYGAMVAPKHFPGYGSAVIPTSGGFPTVTRTGKEIAESDYEPFRAAMNVGAGAVIVGHIAAPQLDSTLLPGVESAPSETVTQGSLPVTFSPIVMTTLLRQQIKFDGLIITDSLQSKNIEAYFKDGQAAVRAVKAGADLLLAPSDVDRAMRALWDAVKRGEIKEERLDESVRRILTAKVRLGVASNRFIDLQILDSFIAGARFQQAAQAIAERSLTLVRNGQELVPIRPETIKSITHIAITDADTNRKSRQDVGLALDRELRRKIPNIQRVVIDHTTPMDQVPTILRQTEGAQTIIISLFAHPSMGENLAELPAAGLSALDELAKSDRPIVVISFGSPYFLIDHPTIRTYICAFGDAGNSESPQKAVARALLGEIPITGRLPVALPGLYPRGHGIQLGVAGPESKNN